MAPGTPVTTLLNRERQGRFFAEQRERPLHRRALRRSRLVTLMKLLLPAMAIALVVMIVAWPQIYRHFNGFSIGFADVQVKDRQVRMIKPRYQGADAQGRPFIITAASATPDTDNSKLVHLVHPKGDMQFDNGTWGLLSSERGRYDEETKMLHLAGNVSVYSNRGYEFHGESAEVDVNAGTVASNEPVHGQGPLGLIASHTFFAYNKGNRLDFNDGVTVTLFPHGRPASSQAANATGSRG